MPNPYYIQRNKGNIFQDALSGYQQGLGLREKMREIDIQKQLDAEKLKKEQFEGSTSMGITDADMGLPSAGRPMADQQGPSAPMAMPNRVALPWMQQQQARQDQAAIRGDARKEAQANRQATQGFGRENTLRDEFNTLSKPFQIIRPMYKNIEAAAMDPASSPQKDMSMIFAYMKLLDPNSTVREGEYANAGKAGTFGDRVKVALNKVESGELLTPQQRQEFLASAKQVYANAETQQKQHIGRYTDLSKRGGVNPEMVVFDYGAGDGQTTDPGASDLASRLNKLRGK